MKTTEAEFLDLLAAYLAGWRSLVDCEEWLASLDWSELDSGMRGAAGQFELLATEVAEGLRREEEFRTEAALRVDRAKGVLYITTPKPVSIASSSNDPVVRQTFIRQDAALPSWSISLQGVSP